MLPMLTREDERGAVRLKVRHNKVHHTVRHNEVRHTLCHNVRYRPSPPPPQPSATSANGCSILADVAARAVMPSSCACDRGEFWLSNA